MRGPSDDDRIPVWLSIWAWLCILLSAGLCVVVVWALITVVAWLTGGGHGG